MCVVSLVAKGKFGKTSKSQNIMKMIVDFDDITDLFGMRYLLLI